MMKALRIGLFALFAVWLSEPPAFGIGGDYEIDADGHITGAQSPDWPAGLAGLINSGPVFHGHWVNTNSEFFYLGDTTSLNRFLKRYATLKHTPLLVVIHAGSARRGELWGEKPKERYDWKVLVLKRGRGAPEKPDRPEEKWVVTVHVWIDHSIRLGELVVPKNANVESGGEIEAFIAEHKNARSANKALHRWGPVTQENPRAVRITPEPIDLAGFQGRIKPLHAAFPSGRPIWFRLEIRNTTDAAKRLYWSSAFPFHLSFDVPGGARFVTGRAIPSAHTEMKLKRYNNKSVELPVEQGVILIPAGRVQEFEIVLSAGLPEGAHVLRFKYQLNPTGGAGNMISSDGAMSNFSWVDLPPVTVRVR